MSSTSWPDIEAAYITTLRAAGRRPRTIEQHRHYLRKLRAVVVEVSRIDLARLELYLSPEHWSPETRKSARAVAVSFCRWLTARGYLERDPSALLMSVKVPAGVARPIPEHVLNGVLERVGLSRERWMVLLGAHAGLRAGEIATVHRDKLVGNLLEVEGKGGRVRYVPLVDDDLVERIKVSAGGWLFPGDDHGHLSAGYVSVLMSRLLPGNWTAHTLRHRAGTVAYAGTRDILAVGQLLGHSKPETTMRYIQLPHDALVAAAKAAAA